ncbi:hypothetical protein [Phenylobacterium sp.]|uniref:hypothetical protein n=1 Tax=Phenylobacterium sp. TaxID=1871053 RepID=UPI002C58E456|nr:hypothetical protein [Phenylobacterium sp.]HVI32181.1 hypothetical protein [Phenylobacterium sp.]
MNRTINRLKLIFLGVFAVLSVGVLVWQVGWVMPMKKCEEAHKWWDHGQRVCAQPVLISDITGRTIQDKQAEAAARAAIGRPPASVQNP